MMRDSLAEGLGGYLLFLFWALLSVVPMVLVIWVAIHFILKFW